jgi:hypothetical protein
MVNSDTTNMLLTVLLPKNRRWMLHCLCALLCAGPAQPAAAGIGELLFGRRTVRTRCQSERSNAHGCSTASPETHCKNRLASSFHDPFGNEPSCFPGSRTVNENKQFDRRVVQAPTPHQGTSPSVHIPNQPQFRNDPQRSRDAAVRTPSILATTTPSEVRKLHTHATQPGTIRRPPLSTSGPVQLLLPYFARTVSEPTIRTGSTH